MEARCMECGSEAHDIVHLHELNDGSWVEVCDCPSAGRANEAGACSGLDLCPDCVATYMRN